MAGITPQAAFNAARKAMRYPFRWGMRTDCTVACVAFEALHGVDPIARHEEHYTTALGAVRKVKKYGSYLAWCNAAFDLPKATTPQAGDLALVMSDGVFGVALAICINPGEYATKTQRGMAITTAEIQGAWTCHLSRQP